MAENDPFGGVGFKLPIVGDADTQKTLDVSKLEDIAVPDIAAATAPVQGEDQIVQAWEISPVCSEDFTAEDIISVISGKSKGMPKRNPQRPPGSCCRDRVVSVPLSEAKARGLPLVAAASSPANEVK